MIEGLIATPGMVWQDILNGKPEGYLFSAVIAVAVMHFVIMPLARWLNKSHC